MSTSTENLNSRAVLDSLNVAVLHRVGVNASNRVFPSLALSIFCRFYRIPFTTHMKKNITHVVQ